MIKLSNVFHNFVNCATKNSLREELQSSAIYDDHVYDESGVPIIVLRYETVKRKLKGR